MSQLDEDREDAEIDSLMDILLGDAINSIAQGTEYDIEIIRPYPGPEYCTDESEFPEGF